MIGRPKPFAMPTPNDSADSHFLEVASELGAEPGGWDFYRGIVDNTAFLCKLIPHDPPRQLFRLRMTEPHHLPSTWISNLPGIYRDAGITCTIDDDYIELIVPEAPQFPADAIATLVRDCIRHHSQQFPPNANYCYDCREKEVVTLEQTGCTVTTICADCLEKRHSAQAGEHHKSNKSHADWSAILPLALLLSATSWAVFWSIYEILAAKARIGTIWFPWLFGLPVILGVGFGLGWSTGTLFHRSGAVKRFSPRALALLTAGATVVLGEFILTIIMVYRLTGSINLLEALRIIIPFTLTQSIFYTGAKMIFAGSLAYAIHHVAKPKKGRLSL